jgi:hypothetical protein
MKSSYNLKLSGRALMNYPSDELGGGGEGGGEGVGEWEGVGGGPPPLSSAP